MRPTWHLIPWLLVPFVAAATGALWPPDAWFAALAKPPWQPPNWLFGPVWTTLYLLMGIAAWRVWRRGPAPDCAVALRWWWVQLALNALWTPVFFGLHAPGPALAVILTLAVLIVLTMRAFVRVDRFAAGLLPPYLAWVSFASVLNASLWWLNR
jgi:tryptophan-rich sensory protein